MQRQPNEVWRKVIDFNRPGRFKTLVGLFTEKLMTVRGRTVSFYHDYIEKTTQSLSVCVCFKCPGKDRLPKKTILGRK